MLVPTAGPARVLATPGAWPQAPPQTNLSKGLQCLLGIPQCLQILFKIVFVSPTAYYLQGVSQGQAAPPVLESEPLSLMWVFTFISLVTSMFPFKRLRAVWTPFVKHLFNSLYHHHQ